MTASGPFALGPTMAGNTATRRHPIAIAVPSTRPSTSSLSSTPAPRIKSEGKDKDKGPQDDEENYSDPDEGVEIVDMENVKNMDWMAPESLKRVKGAVKKPKKEEHQSEEVDTSNALNLSESEEEEELEDIIEDFAQQTPEDLDDSLRQDRLYFFQFPAPFPTFTLKGEAPPPPTDKKRVSFAPTVKAEIPAPATEEKEKPVVDGTIGRLEIYRSGAVKMRLANGILLDVMAATQPSFLQHAVSLDMKEKKLNVLGEVNKRFVVAPDVDVLLEAMERAEREPRTVLEGEESLIKMDTT
ncbi:RNA polymerase III RPC4-domain-containing protein [Desarmillaria ectypa]|nr:RNA polymerase III RPC4-domain-containing protein [Desarmillaria ectypa]